ncbi:MAG: hypothetical protein KDK71_00910 [Chlamydiia bacterium]|nr:hypothetical protein [Chlamydiia bacterium]
MQKLENMGFIEKRKSFIKKKNGSPTKIHKRNYYTFTDAGKAGIEILLNRLFHGQNEPQKNLTIVRKNKPCENLRSQDYLHDEKFLEIKKVFNKYSFENQLFRAYEGTVQILFNHSLEKIEKLLKLMRKKVSKGWKIREFWGFFLKMLKKPQKIQSFFPYLANEYLEAAKGKSSLVTHGIDSRIICESLGKLQKTGESITEGKLARMLLYGTEKLKAALEGICYRSYLGRGTFPEPKAALDTSREIKKRPITKLIKINAQTGKQYTEDDWTNQKDFCLKTIIVGYEDVNRIEKRENTQRVVSQARIQSWVGLLVETLRTCKDCESIYRRYFFSKSNQYA